MILLVALMMAATAWSVRAQPAGEACEVFSEAFDAFTGPHDFADDLIDIRWCLDGASVSNGGFCAGGNALKLVNASDEATLRVAAGNSACTAVTLRFVYSQFAQTGTVLRQGMATAGRSLCSASLPSIVGALDVTGGNCMQVTHTVLIQPGDVVLWRFDHGSAGNTAIFIDDVTIELADCCHLVDAHGCCEVGSAGCADEATMQCVCEIDPYCCEFEWDAQCVALVEQLACGECGAGSGAACLPAFATDLGESFSSTPVCEAFPSVFAQCGGAAAPFMTNSGECGGPGDASMSFAAGLPHSYAQTHCLELAGIAQATLSFSYTKNTGTLGPRVHIIFDDESTETIWSAPIVFDGGCEPVLLDLSSYIDTENIRLRFSSGSSIANGARIDDIVFTTSTSATHSCCEVGEAGCADALVQDCVCAIDSFCCEEQWDELCVLSAEFYECGDCGICSESFAADLDVPDAGGTVCDRFPDLFAACYGIGPLLSNATPCSEDESDYAMVFVTGADVSSVVTRCISLKDVEQASVAFEYSKIDGQFGPVFEASADVGGTWVPLWIADDAPGSGSHEVCVDLQPAVGLNFLLFRFRAGEADAVGQVIDDIVFQFGATCLLPGDVTSDGSVDLDDLLEVIGHWGQVCPGGDFCSGDADGDGLVNLADLLLVIANWGSTNT